MRSVSRERHRPRLLGQPRTFGRMTSVLYTPLPLDEDSLEGTTGLVQQAKNGRLVLYVGAGVSAAAPSNGPMGSAVADRLRHPTASLLGCPPGDLEADTLEQLADKVAALGEEALARLRHLAATTYDFSGFEPNYAHRAIALLMREGLIKTISVNWDCAIERAGTHVGVRINAVTSVIQAQSVSNRLALLKVHGSSDVPDTLKITRSDVDSPQTWAIAQVQAALTAGTIVFTGLATVGDYVADPIVDTLRTWQGYAASVRVAAPSMPPTWSAILGEHADASHFPSRADEFLDSLLRALIKDALDHVIARCHNLAGRESWATTMMQGANHVRATFGQVPAHLALRWWRDGVADTEAGKPFVTSVDGQNALMAVSLLLGADGDAQVAGAGRRFSISSSGQYAEVIARPGAHLADVASIAQSRAEERWEDGAYVDARPITFVVAGAMGRFPALNAVADIAGEEGADPDIAFGLHGPLRFVSAEDAVQGRLAV